MAASVKKSSSRSSIRKGKERSESSRPARRPAKKGARSKKPRYTRPLTLEELAELPDEDIDYSDIPELDEEWFNKATIVLPEERKAHVTVRFDPDIIAFFKRGGRGYQTRMNAVLRAYVDAQKSIRRRPPR